jgi:hypothetical protein
LSIFLFLTFPLSLSPLRQAENDFPEGDVDDMRAQMDAALLRYIAAAERREQLQEKMNNPKKAEEKGDRERDSRGDEEDEEGKKPRDKDRDREKKRSSSRKS